VLCPLPAFQATFPHEWGQDRRIDTTSLPLSIRGEGTEGWEAYAGILSKLDRHFFIGGSATECTAPPYAAKAMFHSGAPSFRGASACDPCPG